MKLNTFNKVEKATSSFISPFEIQYLKKLKKKCIYIAYFERELAIGATKYMKSWSLSIP